MKNVLTSGVHRFPTAFGDYTLVVPDAKEADEPSVWITPDSTVFLLSPIAVFFLCLCKVKHTDHLHSTVDKEDSLYVWDIGSVEDAVIAFYTQDHIGRGPRWL